MSAFLIQVSGHAIEEKAQSEYVTGAQGPRFCDEPLKHGEYFNASPYWKRDGFGRREAWVSVEPGDRILLYCTSSVDEHGACLSHILTVEDVSLDDTDGARLTFSTAEEIIPKVSYGDIQSEIEAGRLSEKMQYCGQEGFNITQIDEADIERIHELARKIGSGETRPHSHPDDSLSSIVDDYFGG